MAFASDAQRRWFFATHPDLTDEHVDAARNYSYGGGWKQLNEALREERLLTPAMRRQVQLLDEAINAAPPVNETVLRGVNFGREGMPSGAMLAGFSAAERDRMVSNALATYAEHRFTPGSEFTLGGGYQSTSVNPEPALDASLSKTNPGIVFEIRARKGLKMAGLQHSAVNDEQEILLPRGARYRVRRVIRHHAFETADGQTRTRTVVVADQL